MKKKFYISLGITIVLMMFQLIITANSVAQENSIFTNKYPTPIPYTPNPILQTLFPKPYTPYPIPYSLGQYILVKIHLSDSFTIEDAAKFGLDIEHSKLYCQMVTSDSTMYKMYRQMLPFDSNMYRQMLPSDELFPVTILEIAVNQQEYIALISKNIKIDIIIPDLEKYTSSILKENKPNKEYLQSEKNFRLGSMGGYFKLEEIYENMKNMRNKYPNYVSQPDTIGYTFEKRPIIAYCLGNCSDSAAPQVLLTAMHHAKEVAGATTLIYFLWNLLENSEVQNSEAKYLLNNRTIYVIPCVNPDGYHFNQENNPDGGGYWRKNRSTINDTIFGVDLNRNYGPDEFWDSKYGSSSTEPMSETYRGTVPFSELETQTVRDFCMAHHFKTALNFHTFGNLLLYPYGAEDAESADSSLYRALANEMTTINKYAYGRGIETVGYAPRGNSDDWMDLAITGKPSIYAVTTEVGNLIDQFWPTQDRIIPLAKENLKLQYQLVWSADVNIRPVDIRSEYDSNNFTSNLYVTLQNIGAESSREINYISLNPLDTAIKIISPVNEIPTLNSAEKFIDTFKLAYPNPDFINGRTIPFEVVIEQSGVPRRDTFFVKQYEYISYDLFKNGDLTGDWDLGNWGWENDNETGYRILSDSPNKFYSDSSDNYLSLLTPTEISGLGAELEFDVRWKIEPRYDFGVVQVSTNGGFVWKYLVSPAMKYGTKGYDSKNSRQIEGSTGFDGILHNWVKQRCSLDSYIGKKILLRFGMLSDKGRVADGLKLNNIKLLLYHDLTNTPEPPIISNSAIKCFPNPIGRDSYLSVLITLDARFSGESINLRLTNTLGQKVYENDIRLFSDGSQRVIIPVNSLAAGLYHVSITGKDLFLSAKCMVVP